MRLHGAAITWCWKKIMDQYYIKYKIITDQYYQESTHGIHSQKKTTSAPPRASTHTRPFSDQPGLQTGMPTCNNSCWIAICERSHSTFWHFPFDMFTMCCALLTIQFDICVSLASTDYNLKSKAKTKRLHISWYYQSLMRQSLHQSNRQK